MAEPLALSSDGAPIIIVYGIADARAALDAAAELGLSVRLKSPIVVAGSLGPQVVCSMIRQVSQAVPGRVVDWVLDCGDDPGLALAALHAGVPEVQVAVREEAYARLADIARQLGIRISNNEADAPVLNLADISDADAACRQWLENLRIRPDCSRVPDCQC